jgi:hypothetical protein
MPTTHALYTGAGYAPATRIASRAMEVVPVRCAADRTLPHPTLEELGVHAANAVRRRVRAGWEHLPTSPDADADADAVTGFLSRLWRDPAGGGVRAAVDDGDGCRVIALDPADVGRAPLYPGQVVRVRAGRVDVLPRALAARPLPKPAAVAGFPVSVSVLCGPYPPEVAGGAAGLLARLLAAGPEEGARRLVFVCGPFVPLAPDADADADDRRYDDRLIAAHRALGRVPIPAHVDVFLVPSFDDAVAPPTFPQPPYALGAGANKNGVPRLLPNPACVHVVVEGVRVVTAAVCMYDGPAHVRAGAAAAGADGPSEAQACAALLVHRTFAPALPSPGLRTRFRAANPPRVGVPVEEIGSEGGGGHRDTWPQYAHLAECVEWGPDFVPDVVALPPAPDGRGPCADNVGGVLFVRPRPGALLTVTVASDRPHFRR